MKNLKKNNLSISRILLNINEEEQAQAKNTLSKIATANPFYFSFLGDVLI